jgi:hypothetical protein
MSDIEAVREILNKKYPDRIFSVEEGVVWVSGMNSDCAYIAHRMAESLAYRDIPTGLVHDDDAVQFGGVQFRWGDSA